MSGIECSWGEDGTGGGGIIQYDARVDSSPESSIDVETTAPARHVYFIDNRTAVNGMFIELNKEHLIYTFLGDETENVGEKWWWGACNQFLSIMLETIYRELMNDILHYNNTWYGRNILAAIFQCRHEHQGK